MKTKKILALVLALLMALSCFALIACNPETPDTPDNPDNPDTPDNPDVPSKSAFTVTYNLNDGTTSKRTLAVDKGYGAIEWQAVREDYDLIGWFTDKDCTQAYDFSKGVTEDLQLYAKWAISAAVRKVSIDANYGGARKYSAIKVVEGDKLTVEQLPKIEKRGMDIEGWYKDAACTQAYNFETPVTANFTLYPKYVYNNKIARYTAEEAAQIDGVSEGDIKFEDITVGVYCKGSGVYGLFKGMAEEINALIKDFNAEYGATYTGADGKEHYRIKIDNNALWTTTIQDQSRFQLRIQQIPETNNNLKNYLNINELLDLANMDTSYYDRDNWYAINDTYVNGGLLSVPFGAKIPFIVYNKAQMTEILGADGKLPTKYSEFADVFAKAWTKYGATAGYQTLIQTRAWPYRECVSATAFIQNGVPYYRYDVENNRYYTDWATAQGKAKALTALTNMNNLLGVGGSLHGKLVNYNDNKNDITAVVNPVLQGKALAGIVSWYDDYNKGGTDVIKTVMENVESGKLGILPLSGLYSDNGDEWSRKIPVNTVGIQVCILNSNHSDEYFAACALFSDYIVKHADRFAQHGVFPMNKAVAQATIYDKEESALSVGEKFLKTVAPNPDDLFTMDGYVLGKPLATEIAGTKSVNEFYNGYLDNILYSTDSSNIQKYLDIIAHKLTATFVTESKEW